MFVEEVNRIVYHLKNACTLNFPSTNHNPHTLSPPLLWNVYSNPVHHVCVKYKLSVSKHSSIYLILAIHSKMTSIAMYATSPLSISTGQYEHAMLQGMVNKRISIFQY